MLVIVDEREIVREAYRTGFTEAGVSTTKFAPQEFCQWVDAAAEPDLQAVEAFLLGSFDHLGACPKLIRGRSQAPIIALSDHKCLDETLKLFAAGVDDVVRKPVHVREILARVGAIGRRAKSDDDYTVIGDLQVYFDGRDPEIRGETLVLPRRERRILEFLVSNASKRVTKGQIFNAIYGRLYT